MVHVGEHAASWRVIRVGESSLPFKGEVREANRAEAAPALDLGSVHPGVPMMGSLTPIRSASGGMISGRTGVTASRAPLDLWIGQYNRELNRSAVAAPRR